MYADSLLIEITDEPNVIDAGSIEFCGIDEPNVTDAGSIGVCVDALSIPDSAGEPTVLSGRGVGIERRSLVGSDRCSSFVADPGIDDGGVVDGDGVVEV